MDILISSATHRMGSTLLQRIFNIRKNTLIWGENGGALKGFINIKNMTSRFSRCSEQERNNYFNNNENPNTWIANMTPSQKYVDDAIIKSTQLFFNTLYSEYKVNHDMIGFKEVRFGINELEFFNLVYPNSNIILLVRHPVNTYNSVLGMNSKWYKNDVNNFMNVWNTRLGEYILLSKKFNNMHLVKYEDITQRDKDTLNIISSIGKLNISDIDQVINHKIGSSSRNNKEFITSQQKQIILKSMQHNLYK